MIADCAEHQTLERRVCALVSDSYLIRSVLVTCLITCLSTPISYGSGDFDDNGYVGLDDYSFFNI
jgi:hypothetical protein